jgi:hypothetical protein
MVDARMLILMSVYLGLIFTAVWFSNLPVGQALHSVLIAGPASWLMRTPLQRIAIILLLLVCVSLAWSEIGPLLVAADYAPLLWIADMSLYLEVLLVVATATAVLRAKSVVHQISSLLPSALGAHSARRRPRARSSRPRRHPKQSPPSDEHAHVLAVWMAA